MDEDRQRSAGRIRWAALGAAVAVLLGAGGVAVTGASLSSGERSAFVPITPCRLFDTRASAPVGPKTSPLGPGETFTQTVWGTNGDCTIPTDALAVGMNVTVLNGTAGSFLTVWPADVGKPNASSLNWRAGDPPIPNKVDVRLSADGKVNLFNLGGSVDVIADVVGYYADHNHDDRYYTKAQTDSHNSVAIGHAAFVSATGQAMFTGGCERATAAVNLEASVPLPLGVTITGFEALVIDDNATTNLTLSLGKVTGTLSTVASATSTGAPDLTTLIATAATPERVDPGEYFYMRFTPGANFVDMHICGVRILYSNLG